MNKLHIFVATIVLFMLCGERTFALPPTDAELFASKAFVSAKFDQILLSPPMDNTIEVIENYNPLIQNVSWLGPITIGKEEYESGLFCHAPSRLKIHLAKAAKRFTADIGIDVNRTTSSGSGSVQFMVIVDDREIFHSETLHGTQEAIPLDLPLHGAQEFILAINDSGDGISCDQSNWANAKVEFEDGSFVWLGDLPVTNQPGPKWETGVPFSFVYDGVHSSQFIQSWSSQWSETVSENGKNKRTLTLSEPNGKLKIFCDVTTYDAFPHVEWMLRFRNDSDGNTPIIESVLPLDLKFSRGEGREFLLHHAIGSPCRQDDYLPLSTELTPNISKTIATSGGRATDESFSYFSLDCGHGEGMIMVIGWPGQWSSLWTRDAENGLHVTAGQELTHFVLYPHEEVRSPLIVVQPWKRNNWIDAQNVWRAWMIAHNIPRKNSVIIDHQMGGCSSQQFREMGDATAADQKHFIDRYLEEKIDIDYWWMDAGWYPCGGDWPVTGSWWPDPQRFPNGLREVNEYADAKKLPLGNVVWFEPERVHSGTWLTENHPEWIHGGKNGGLLKLSDPEVLAWAIETFDGLIKSEKIQLYRQDFNIAPLDYWRQNDTEDRQGITEIRHIENYLKFWDTLLEKNPGLRIDSCASGGRRNDLESMRRAVPLHRSDFIHEPTAQQVHTYGLSLWLPVHGSCVNQFTDYEIRSTWIPCMNLCYDLRKTDSDYENLRKNIAIWKQYLTPYYLDDFHPLTSISTQTDEWVGWQFNSPEKGEGAIQMFRRPKSRYIQGAFPLYGLEPKTVYKITNIDTGETVSHMGEDLMKHGLIITIKNCPQAVLFHYEKSTDTVE